MAEDIVCQLVKLRILERPDAVTNHKQRFFRHECAECVLKLRHTVKIDEERSADLNNGVVARQQSNEIREALSNGDVTQLAGISYTGQQHLVLIATAQNFLHASHHAGSVVVLLHLAVERVAHYRAVQ